jgi:hypothetical protein
MKLLMLALGPFISYFIVLIYAAVHGSIFGREVLRVQGDVLTEYLIILGMYYTLCLLGPTLRKYLNPVALKVKRMYKYCSKR